MSEVFILFFFLYLILSHASLVSLSILSLPSNSLFSICTCSPATGHQQNLTSKVYGLPKGIRKDTLLLLKHCVEL